MALINPGSGVYYESFSDGQGLGLDNYFTYESDMDTNFVKLRVCVNLLDERITAVGGPNALIPLRAEGLNDADGPQAWPPGCTNVEVTDGFLGAHSYVVTVGSPTSEADITKGQLIVGGQFCEQSAGVSLSGVSISGGAQDHYFSVDTQGVVSVSDTPSSRDFATLAWDGAQYTGTWERQLPVLFDGDAWRQLQERPSGLAFPAELFEEPDERLLALERILSGYTTDGLGTTIGPLCFPFGTAANPWFCFGTAGTPDDAGLIRPAADAIAYTDGTSEITRLHPEGIAFQIDGSPSAPTLQLNDDDDGLYNDGTGPAVAAGGNRAMRWDGSRTRVEPGTAALPAITEIDDPNTGHEFPGDDTLAGSTAGNRCYLFDATGNLDLPLQSRCSTSVAGYAVTASAYDGLDMDTEVYDVGSWHSGSSQSHTCPTGADGIYLVTGQLAFLESTIGGGGTPNSGNTRGIALAVGGTPVGQPVEITPKGSGDTKLAHVVVVALSATDVVTLEAFHDNTTGDSTMNTNGNLQISKIA